MKLTRVLLLVLLAWCCDAYKILVVFPMTGRSHGILGEGVVRRLLGAGHQVTYITGVPINESSPNLHQINVFTNTAAAKLEEACDINKIINEGKEIVFNQMSVEQLMIHEDSVAMQENVQKLMMSKEEFDLVIIEWLFNELLVGLPAVFNCPYIWLSSLEPHGVVLSLIDEYTHPAYVPDIHSREQPPFTFIQRVVELWKIIRNKYVKWYLSPMEKVMYERAFGAAAAARGRRLPALEEVKHNASLMLGNSHVSAGQATTLPQSYKPIRGYHIQDQVAALPGDLKRIMDGAKNGVIYFSMGSILQSKRMPKTLKEGLLDMFGSLKQTVIWKLEEAPKNLPKNVHVLSFAPQQSILAHPNCILFVTHGGMLSTTEAIHFGVPIIGVPAFGDQFININRAVHKGFARRVPLGYQLPGDLRVAIEEMIENPRYREKVKELSFIYHHRPVTPGKELLHWVDHVVMTRGAPHLRSPALLVPWYQKMYLDLIALVLVSIATLCFVLKRLLRRNVVKMKQN